MLFYFLDTRLKVRRAVLLGDYIADLVEMVRCILLLVSLISIGA